MVQWGRTAALLGASQVVLHTEIPSGTIYQFIEVNDGFPVGDGPHLKGFQVLVSNNTDEIIWRCTSIIKAPTHVKIDPS